MNNLSFFSFPEQKKNYENNKNSKKNFFFNGKNSEEISLADCWSDRLINLNDEDEKARKMADGYGNQSENFLI